MDAMEKGCGKISIYIYISLEGLWKGGRRQEIRGKRGKHIGSVDQDCAITLG